jgi:hypothetical protein
MINLTPQQLRLAADLQEKIAALNQELALILTSGKAIPAPIKAVKQAKRTISPAHIAKIRAAQKRRWAKVKAAKGTVPAAKPAKRKISPEGIARIKAAQKARWAAIKAGKQ